MPALKVFANPLENQRRKHPAEPVAQECILADGGSVVHLPQPDIRLTFGISRPVNVGVVLRFRSDVPGVETMQHRTSRGTQSRRVGWSSSTFGVPSPPVIE